MSNTIESIKKMLDQKEAERLDLFKTPTRYGEKEKELLALKARQKVSLDFDEVKQLETSIQKLELELRFLKTLPDPTKGKLISPEEYNECREVINGEVNKLIEEYAPKIEAKFLECLALFDEYDAKVDALEHYESIAFNLKTGRPSFTNLRGRIREAGTDPFEWFSALCTFYYTRSPEIKKAKKNPEAVLKGFGSSPQAMRYAKAVLEAKKHN